MKLHLAWLFAVATLATTSAQQPGAPAPVADGLIMGRAIDGVTGRPLGGVTVSLGSGPAGATTLPTGGLQSVVQANPTRVMTSADGMFMFRGVPKGSYTIAASKPGYVNGAFGKRTPEAATGRPLEVADAERRGGITVPLWKFGVISGSVIDESGEPLIGVQVRVLRRTIVAGRWQLTQTGNMPSTDDRGIYRMSLLPGDYVAAVVSTQATVPAALTEAYAQAALAGGQSDFMRGLDSAGASLSPFGGLRVGALMLQPGAQGPGSGSVNEAPRVAPIRDGSPLLVYPTVFYPGGATASEATPIKIEPGQDRSGIDFQLRPVPSVRVAGTVSGPDGPSVNTGLQLLPAGIDEVSREYGFEAATTITDAAGEFTFLGVTPGQYTIKVLRAPQRPEAPGTAFTTVVQVGSSTIFSSSGPAVRPPIPDVPTYWGMMPVSVGNRDVEGLALTLRSGARIAGAVEFDGASEKPTVDRLRQVQISIEPSDGRSIGSLSSLVQLRQGQLDAQGRISTYQLPAGKYVIRPQTLPGWTFEGAYLEGRDVSHFPLELGADDMAGVVLKFTDRPPELSGTVRSENGAGDPTAMVLIFPRDERGWTDYGASPRRLRSVSPDTNGAYRVTGLPTGEYLVAAVNEEALQPWQDPAVLQKLAGLATSVTIGPGEKKSQDLVVRGLR